MEEFENESLFPSDDDEAEQILRKLDQDRVNDTRAEWLQMYGFDHECSCAADVEEGRTVEISVCYAEACDNAFAALRRARAFLYAITTSPTQNTAVLKALAGEAFFG